MNTVSCLAARVPLSLATITRLAGKSMNEGGSNIRSRLIPEAIRHLQAHLQMRRCRHVGF
jgi:hypothetical protein